MASSLWLSWLLLTAVSALPWSGPRETVSATATADWSPVPTNEVHELIKRLLYPVSLCGWQGADYQNVYCSSGSSCAWFTDYSVIGCCSISGSCDAVYTSCINGNHPPQSVSYPGVLTCTSTSVCYLNTYPSEYFQYGCGTTSVGETVVTSWTGANPQFSIAIAYTGGVLETEVPVILKATKALSTTPLVTSGTSLPTNLLTTALTVSTKPTITATAAAPSPSTSEAAAPSPSRSEAAAASSSTSEATPAPGHSLIVTNSAITSAPTSYAAPFITSTLSIAPSAIPKTTTTSETPSRGLSAGAKIAISVVATVVAIIAAVLTIFYCCFGRPKQGEPSDTTADGGIECAPPYELKGSESNPVELYQNHQPQTEDVQYIPATVPSYQTAAQTSVQSATELATVPTVSPRSSTMSPTPTMTTIPDVFELSTNWSAAPITGAAPPELDNSEIRNSGLSSSYRGNSNTMAEGNLARLNREMEQVRAEKEMAIRLQQLERREAELKEQILEEQKKLIND